LAGDNFADSSNEEDDDDKAMCFAVFISVCFSATHGICEHFICITSWWR